MGTNRRTASISGTVVAEAKTKVLMEDTAPNSRLCITTPHVDCHKSRQRPSATLNLSSEFYWMKVKRKVVVPPSFLTEMTSQLSALVTQPLLPNVQEAGWIPELD
jgi:hypothetical protein